MKINYILITAIALLYAAILASEIALADSRIGAPVTSPFKAYGFDPQDCPVISGVYRRPDMSTESTYSLARYSVSLVDGVIIADVGLPMNIVVDGTLKEMSVSNGRRSRYQAFCLNKEVRVQVVVGRRYAGYIRLLDRGPGEIEYAMNVDDGTEHVHHAFIATKVEDVPEATPQNRISN